MKYLVTGSAGFIGYHLSQRLLNDGHEVIGFDAMTPYYDVSLKEARHARLKQHNGFSAVIGQLEDAAALQGAADMARPDVIAHFAAQAGVRYSIEEPRSYVDANIVGTLNVLELAKRLRPAHLLLASTSSVYGANSKIPFEEGDQTDKPLNVYAATKIAMEAMAHAYSCLNHLPITALRFFTVYGPWGRPDMALFKFTDAILAGQPIDVYGEGLMERDFTYVDDLVEAIIRLAPLAPPAAPTPFRAVNIGGGSCVSLMSFINIIEEVTGRKAILNLLPIQPGEMPRTYAAPELLRKLTGYVPATPLRDGVAHFVAWHHAHYSR